MTTTEFIVHKINRYTEQVEEWSDAFAYFIKLQNAGVSAITQLNTGSLCNLTHAL